MCMVWLRWYMFRVFNISKLNNFFGGMLSVFFVWRSYMICDGMHVMTE